MIDAKGTVVSTDGNYAVVSMGEEGCGRCYEQGGCGGVNIGKMFCRTPRTFRLLNPDKSVVGDQVRVVIADGVVRRTAAWIYGLPLAALFAGAIGGAALGGDAGAMTGALGGLVLSLVALRHAHLRNRHKQNLQPYIST